MSINGYGFFLQESGDPGRAAGILAGVSAVDPGRTAAYLNLADALWVLGRPEEAGPLYAEYLRLLEGDGLLDHAPGYVMERME